METVPRIHVQELLAAVKQQYKTAPERGVPKGSRNVGPSAAERETIGNRRTLQEFDDDDDDNEEQFVGDVVGGRQVQRREKRDDDGEFERQKGRRPRRGRTEARSTGSSEGGGGKTEGIRSGGKTERLDAAETVLFLRRRQAG